MTGCEKCSGHEDHHDHKDDCCSTHSVKTSSLGGKIFKYSMTFLAGVAVSFFAFQPSKVYQVNIDQDRNKDIVVEGFVENLNNPGSR
ncbi:hypothetical protein HY837_07040 [archaeon]|nr:hypothetical protein [archaeon]